MERVPRRARPAERITACRVGRAVAHNPKVAAVGALAGGWAGQQIGQQSAYGHLMTSNDRYRRANRYNPTTMVGKAVGTAEHPRPLSRREETQLRRRKSHSAALSAIGGTAGLGAFGATLGQHAPKIPEGAKLRLKRVQVPLLTLGAGVGGTNALLNAGIQRKEATAKAAPRIRIRATGRAPAMRRGYIRSVRSPRTNATKVSTVRGGLA